VHGYVIARSPATKQSQRRELAVPHLTGLAALHGSAIQAIDKDLRLTDHDRASGVTICYLRFVIHRHRNRYIYILPVPAPASSRFPTIPGSFFDTEDHG
jgi:hypothetical protein